MDREGRIHGAVDLDEPLSSSFHPRGRRRWAEHIAKRTVIAWSRAAGSRRIVWIEPFDTIKCLSLERSGRRRDEGNRQAALNPSESQTCASLRRNAR